MVRIFPRNPSLLTFQDFRNCVRKVAEGTYIEYKEEIPSKLGKHIAAFANSYGGYCILGVVADRKTNCPIRFPGLELEDGIKEKIRNHIISQVHPIPLFSVELTQLPKSPRGVISLVVEVSPNPPHLVGDGRIYVRNAEGSDPVPITDRHSVDRLYDRARHHRSTVEARLARTLWRSVFPIVGRHSGQVAGDTTPETMTLSLVVNPVYGIPGFDCDLLSSPPKRDLLRRLAIHGYSVPHFTQTGIILPRGAGSSWSETEISSDGMIEYREQISAENPDSPFHDQWVTKPLADLLWKHAAVCAEYQYLGPLLILVGLGHVKNRRVGVEVYGLPASRGCPDLNVEIVRETTAHAMTQQNDRQELVESIRQEALRAFGWPVGY